MNYYKAIIQYDGTNYFGFQWQKGIVTVQNDLNLALGKILSGKISTMSASRTDTGVHAIEQIVKLTTEYEIESDLFLIQLNQILPLQIRCVSFMPCEASYQPTTGHKSKEYRYLFTTRLKMTCNDQKFISNHPYQLDLELMKECARMMVGQHDFRNFCSAGSNVKTTIREILFCEVSEVNPHTVLPQSDLFIIHPDLRQCYQLRIEGTGFLKQMVRHLVSALWLVGRGKLSLDQFSYILNGPQKTKRLWKVASPRGLYLYKFKS